MGYRDSNSDASRWTIKRIGLILVGLIFAGIAKVATHDGIDFVQQKTVSPLRVESAMESNDKFGPTFLELKADFPEEYHQISSEMAHLIRAGASEQEISKSSFNAMRQFTNSHMSQIASASDQTLSQVALAHARIAKSLSLDDNSLCAAFGFDGLQPGMQFPPSVVDEMSAATQLMIRAAHEGATRPVPRNTATLTDGDSRALVAGMKRKGVTEEEFSIFDSDAAMDRASTVEKCRLTTAMYDSIGEMPAPLAARVTSFLLMQVAAERMQPTT